MGLHESLLLGHLIGAVLGVGGATFIEVNLNLALKDGRMDDAEKKFMARSFTVTRLGMFLGLVTGIGFILEYALYDQLFRLENGVFWAKMAMFLIIVINATLLHKHKIGLYWGSAFSFVSWWLVMILGSFLSNGVKILPAEPLLSFFVIMVAYGFMIVAGAQILHLVRQRNKTSGAS